MSPNDNNLLSIPIFVLSVFGVHPFSEANVSKKAFIILSGQISVVSLAFFRLVTDLHNADADIWITWMCSLQSVVKVLVVIVNRQSFYETGEMLNNFWSASKFGASVAAKLQNIESAVRKANYIYAVILSVAYVGYVTKAVALRQRVLPSDWYPICDIQATITCYVISYCVQACAGLYVISILMAFDCMFWSLLAHAYIEMEQIKEALLRLSINRDRSGDDDDVLREISDLVRYHNQIFTLITKVQGAYAGVLMYQFIAALIIICMSEFCLTTNGFPPSAHAVLSDIPYLLLGSSEIFMYCKAGEMIAEQSESIAYAAYESDWWVKDQPRMRKALCIIMIRAQKTCKITVGGLWELNMATFVAILKATFTMLAFMKMVYGR